MTTLLVGRILNICCTGAENCSSAKPLCLHHRHKEDRTRLVLRRIRVPIPRFIAAIDGE